MSLTNLDNDFPPQANDDSDITRSNTPVITTVLANDQGLAPPVNVSISKLLLTELQPARFRTESCMFRIKISME